MDSKTVIQTTPEQLTRLIDQSVSKALKNLSSTKTGKEFYTRKELAALFSCNLSTIYNWTVKGKLNAYAIGNRVFYKVDEVHSSLVKL